MGLFSAIGANVPLVVSFMAGSGTSESASILEGMSEFRVSEVSRSCVLPPSQRPLNDLQLDRTDSSASLGPRYAAAVLDKCHASLAASSIVHRPPQKYLTAVFFSSVMFLSPFALHVGTHSTLPGSLVHVFLLVLREKDTDFFFLTFCLLFLVHTKYICPGVVSLCPKYKYRLLFYLHQ